jgi:tetratricopeptide (TPR) repeat protein
MLPDRLAIARCLHNLANVVRVCGDYSRAQQALCEAVDIFEELGDSTGAAWSINQQGDIARAQGDTAGARMLYQRALGVFRKAGDPWGCARSLTDLAYSAGSQGDYLVGHAACREALAIFTGLGYRRGIARALESSAYLALAQGHAERALTLAAAAAHLRKSICAPRHHSEQNQLHQTLLPAWGSLSAAAGARAWAEGVTMSLERAIQYSLGELVSATTS